MTGQRRLSGRARGNRRGSTGPSATRDAGLCPSPVGRETPDRDRSKRTTDQRGEALAPEGEDKDLCVSASHLFDSPRLHPLLPSLPLVLLLPSGTSCVLVFFCWSQIRDTFSHVSRLPRRGRTIVSSAGGGAVSVERPA